MCYNENKDIVQLIHMYFKQIVFCPVFVPKNVVTSLVVLLSLCTPFYYTKCVINYIQLTHKKTLVSYENPPEHWVRPPVEYADRPSMRKFVKQTPFMKKLYLKNKF